MSASQFPSALAHAIDVAAKKLAAGGLVIYPTETFYGLGAALSHPEALRRLAELKGREGSKPMPVIAGDEQAARGLWTEVPEIAGLLMHRFWPGPLTIVLPARPGLPFEVAQSGEIGVRVSSNPIARELALRVGPIAATSANLSGAGEKAKLSELDPLIVDQVDAVIDGGRTPGGRSSTVLRLTGGKPAILREGAIQRALIEACLPPQGQG